LKHLPERGQQADRAAKLMEMIRFEHRSYGRIERLIQQVKAFNPSQPRDELGRWVETGAESNIDEPSAFELVANDGTPGDPERQNKQFRDVVRILKLDRKTARRLHDEISGENYGFHEILRIGKELSGK
jgi:hypothetical protein